jgi:hypothetical protein
MINIHTFYKGTLEEYIKLLQEINYYLLYDYMLYDDDNIDDFQKKFSDQIDEALQYNDLFWFDTKQGVSVNIQTKSDLLFIKNHVIPAMYKYKFNFIIYEADTIFINNNYRFLKNEKYYERLLLSDLMKIFNRRELADLLSSIKLDKSYKNSVTMIRLHKKLYKHVIGIIELYATKHDLYLSFKE